MASPSRSVVSQRRLAAVSRNDAHALHIQVKAEVVVAIAAVPACVHVMDTLHSSAQEAKIAKFV